MWKRLARLPMKGDYFDFAYLSFIDRKYPRFFWIFIKNDVGSFSRMM
jgi:hypothetical protein